MGNCFGTTWGFSLELDKWEVVETTIQDVYEIVLNLTYETDVPAAVVVAEPASINLPKTMKAGDVFYGEFTLTNYGLIRADNIQFALPQSDQNFKYELLSGLPSSLGAKERITVPYRVTALRSLDQAEEGSGSGGGCQWYFRCLRITYDYECSNGDRGTGQITFCWIYYEGECGGEGGIGGGDVVIGGPVEGGGPGGGGWSPNLEPIVGVICWPVSVRIENLFDGEIPSLKEIWDNILHTVGCSVNTVLREYYDETVDLSVKVPGGNIEIKRLFYGNEWRWEHERNNLKFNWDSLGQKVESIDKGGVIYKSDWCKYPAVIITPTDPPVFVYLCRPIYTHGTYYLVAVGLSHWEWYDQSGNWKRFDSNGRMTSYGTRTHTGIVGNLLYEAGENGKLIGIADRNDRQVIWFEYNGAGQISAVRDVDNRRVEYTYTGDRLTKVRDALGYEALYEFDSNGRLSKSTDYAGRQSFVSYDSYGNVSEVIDKQGKGHFFQYYYDEAKKEYYAQIKTSSGMVKEVWYDQDGETKQVDVNGRTIQRIVKEGRNLIITDEKGNVTRKEFDEWDNLTGVVYPDESTVSFEYYHLFSTNQLTKLTDPRGNVNTYEYDNQRNLIKKIEAVGTSEERTTTYSYDNNNQLLTATIEGDANTEAAMTSLTYDLSGNLSSITDPEGNKTDFLQYDNIGNLLRMKDPRGYIWTFDYDDRGRLISQTDPLNNTTTYEYDGANNRTAIINAYLKRFDFEYNEYNKLIKAIDPSQKYITTEYNTDNFPTKIIDPKNAVQRGKPAELSRSKHSL